MALPPGAPRPQRGASSPGDELVQSMRSNERRLKMLEERLTNMRSKLQVTEQNMIQKNKVIFEEIRAYGLEITDVKKDIQELKEKILWVVKEIQDCAKREQVEMLKKYLDYWNPFKFVTKNDVDAIVRDVIDQMRRGKDIQELKEKILWVVKEIQDCAKREQVEMLKKYLDFWNPFKFVTKNDVDAIVRDVIDQMRRGK